MRKRKRGKEKGYRGREIGKIKIYEYMRGREQETEEKEREDSFAQEQQNSRRSQLINNQVDDGRCV